MATYPQIIENWDDGQPGATWDSGLQWDINSGPSAGDAQPYLDLVTSKHRDKPDFIATLSFILQPILDTQAVEAGLYLSFDMDVAIGAQLDVVGEWVGQSRELSVPLTNVYFSLGVAGLGFGQGTWKGPFDPSTYLVSLPDDSYRLLLRAKALNNSWDGTVQQAYDIWDVIFEGTGFGLLIQDYGNMHMLFAITGPIPDAVTLALFTGGYLNNRPSGVKVDGYATPSVPDTPYFGFGAENASVAGFGVGAWATIN